MQKVLYGKWAAGAAGLPGTRPGEPPGPGARHSPPHLDDPISPSIQPDQPQQPATAEKWRPAAGHASRTAASAARLGSGCANKPNRRSKPKSRESHGAASRTQPRRKLLPTPGV